jgi:hypothetical protein
MRLPPTELTVTPAGRSKTSVPVTKVSELLKSELAREVCRAATA